MFIFCRKCDIDHRDHDKEGEGGDPPLPASPPDSLAHGDQLPN